MLKKSFMPHGDSYRFPMSRDHGRDNIKCRRDKCICNRSGHCIMPSRCEIGDDGMCTGFTIDKTTKEKKSE
jgi:hypothetical protein